VGPFVLEVDETIRVHLDRRVIVVGASDNWFYLVDYLLVIADYRAVWRSERTGHLAGSGSSAFLPACLLYFQYQFGREFPASSFNQPASRIISGKNFVRRGGHTRAKFCQPGEGRTAAYVERA
jgi:hypothetical protein